MEHSSQSVMVENHAAVCDEHGPYTAHQLVIGGIARRKFTGCPECAETRREAEERERKLRDEAERQARIERRLGAAGIPLRFRGKTFSSYVVDSDSKQSAMATAMAYANEFKDRYERGANLVFSGNPGTGKSHLACAIAQHIMEDGYTALYLTAMDMVRLIRSTWRRDGDRTETDVMNDLSAVHLLILDEVGMQYGTEGEQVILTDVIDRRYRDQLPTIILTNQDKKGLLDYLGHRAFDRLREEGTWESFDWDSHRARRAA